MFHIHSGIVPDNMLLLMAMSLHDTTATIRCLRMEWARIKSGNLRDLQMIAQFGGDAAVELVEVSSEKPDNDGATRLHNHVATTTIVITTHVIACMLVRNTGNGPLSALPSR